jgi:uncharacterized protein (TIGR03435 family)
MKFTLALMLAALALAQTPGTTQKTVPGFEVATIKPADPASTGATMAMLPGGRLSISGMTIKNLIALAYGIKMERISGGPGWLDSKLYNIDAKPPAGSAWELNEAGKDEQFQRIRKLLADRFALKAHRETVQAPVYVLTVEKTGLKMQEAKADTAKRDASIIPWNLFVTDLSRRVGRHVVDKTGLAGSWYVALRYSTDDGHASGIGVRIDPDTPAGAWPSIFVAVREQLGLRLDSAKGPVDKLVIDSISPPSPN